MGWQIVGGLSVTLSLVALLYWFSNRFLERVRSSRSIRVVESVSLGEKKSLLIVEVDGQRLLLGATSGSISQLEHLGDARPEEKTAPVKGVRRVSFASILRSSP